MQYPIKLLDEDHKVLATALVENKGSHYGGTVDLRAMPPALCALFEEYENLVAGQVLSLLDEVKDRIPGHSISADFGDGQKVCVNDLQIFPKAHTVSFKSLQKIATASASVVGI